GQSPEEIVGRVEREMGIVNAASGNVVDKGAVQVMVTEWSCALDGASWARHRGHSRDDMHRRFGHVQTEKWRERCGGSYFWTAKAQHLLEDWNFAAMVKKGAVAPPKASMFSFSEVGLRCEKAMAQKDQHKKAAVDAHIAYWDRTAPKTPFEHWRFDHGWNQGFADALNFFQMRAVSEKRGERGGDTIGMLELWVLKRIRDAGQESAFAWEWEHGFRQGVKVCEDLTLG
ncbi:MAG: hypothetical protein Q9164_002287, partial [Protoblastenia rupestris]